MIPNALKNLILTSLTLSASLAWTDVFADCVAKDTGGTEKSITLPATIAIESAKIGSVLASNKFDPWTKGTYRCAGGEKLSLLFNGGLELSGYPNVYKTSIKGIGLKVGITFGGDVFYAPYSWYANNWSDYNTPRSVVVELVRIDTGVASGNLSTDFNVTFSAPGMAFTVKSTGSTQVENDVLFSGCTAVDTLVNVQMGQENIDRLKSDRVAVRPFNFDVRCTGLKPNTTAPMKVYFAGNSSADGMLALSNAGKPGVASGIGIALVDDKGVKLPFAKARSIRVEHHRSDEEGEIYRFSGTAKYTLTTGTVKPGKADATMTYVIDYN